MSQALYRKYRPRKLTEVVGQEHVTEVLDRAIKAGQISHAYLLTGLRGTGKTSIARILAHEINNLDYTDDKTTHLDIIEIDAASNRRIDEIRDLRDKIHIAPASAKYKVYIIDEVHMLTKEAFNALLKTLEEPPAHCIFILATTEIHKVPDTIISRTQRFSLKPIDQSAVVKHLASIASQEKINIDNEALELIAAHGHGSLRDSTALLDQIGSGTKKQITLDDVQEILGMARVDLLNQIQEVVLHGNVSDVLKLMDNITDAGLSPSQLAKQLIDTFHDRLLSENSEPHRLLNLIDELMGVASADNPSLKLEMLLLRATLKPSEVVSNSSQSPEALKTEAKHQPTDKHPDKSQNLEHTEKEPETKAVADTNSDSKPLDTSTWQAILEYVKEHSPSLTASLRMAAPHLSGQRLLLKFAQSFHQKRNASAKTKDIISQAVKQVMGTAYEIESIVEKGVEPLLGTIELTRDLLPVPAETDNETEKPSQVVADDAKSVIDLFGGGEVV